MAKIKELPGFLERLRGALVQSLKEVGIVATVNVEPIPTTRLFRVAVLAAKFEVLRPSERQDLVWRIAEQNCTAEELLRISMIVTLTPREIRGIDGRGPRHKELAFK